MTDADKAAYAKAFSGAKACAERIGHKIDGVTWRNGHMTVTTHPIEPAEPEPVDVGQGTLL